MAAPVKTDTVRTETPATDSPVTKTGQTRGIETTPATGNNEILAHIDKHLVSAAQFTASAGGITNGTVSITNTLPAASFQKVMVEVQIRSADGGELRTDYYTAINIEPGGVKMVKIPNSPGTKIVTRIIKVKSAELTKGEFVLAGDQFVPGQ